MKKSLLSLRAVVLLVSFLTSLNSVLGQTSPSPKIVGSPTIIIDRITHTGFEVLTLRNSNAKPTQGNSNTGVLNLKLEAVVNTSTNDKPKITFKNSLTATDESPTYPLTIQPDQERSVIVMARNVTAPGEYEIELRDRDNTFGKMKIIHLPFNVTLDGPSPDEANLAMVDDYPTTIALKNDDPVAYPLFWRLTINGREICGDKLTLAAKGLGLIQCRPSLPLTPARLQDLVKVDSTEGHFLRLYPEKTGGVFDPSSPWKEIRVKASLSHFGQAAQQVGGYILIVLVLIAGGVASLILSQALPNRLKRLNIRERLMDTGRATSNLSSKIGSRLQVLLRLERNRLLEVLRSRNTLSPDFTGIVTRCSEGINKLEARVALVQQIDVVLERLDQKLTLGPPPSKISEIEALIEDAKVLVMKAQPTDKDLEAAQLAIAEAAKKVDELNEIDPVFGESLAKRALEVQQDIATVAASPTFVRITRTLPGPNAALQAVRPGTTTIAPANYASVDMAVEKMLVLKDYVLMMEGTADPDRLDRLQKREEKLLDLLQLQSWAALRSARLLLREMNQDVYPERLKEKLVAEAATIVMEPLVAYDKALLEFCVCFHSPAIDDAAAKEEWTCEWAFGDNLTETGWSASHYFQLTKPSRFKSATATEYVVQASFRDSNGDPLLDDNNAPVTVQKPVTVLPSKQEGFFGDRTRTELIKLVAALLIAVFALVAGAREQLLKLDVLPGLIAVFMVGFSADTIKNLLTKSESASSG